jgi:hypothetical protein
VVAAGGQPLIPNIPAFRHTPHHRRRIEPLDEEAAGANRQRRRPRLKDRPTLPRDLAEGVVDAGPDEARRPRRERSCTLNNRDDFADVILHDPPRRVAIDAVVIRDQAVDVGECGIGVAMVFGGVLLSAS